MRKVQDFYFKKAKKEHYPARSVYKLQEAQEKYRFLKKGQRVLDLGCHPGSWSLYAATQVGPRGVVVGVDRQLTRLAGPQKGHAEIHWFCYDVFSEELVGRLRQQWPGFQVILSDMAPKTTGNPAADHLRSMRLLERVFQLTGQLLHPGGTVYVKGFQGEDFPAMVRQGRQLFTTVKVVKPASSRRESREVFLLGRGFHR